MAVDTYIVPPGFEAESFDFAEETTPRQFYMIASTPRSGGTLLSQHLWSSGIMGAPAEYFGFYSTFLRLVARLQPDTIEDYMTRLMPRRTTANGVFGFKVHYDHLQFMLLSGMLTRIGKMQVIAIERQDRLAQAVSHARALQTGQWNSLNKAQRAEPAYNADLIRWSANHLGAQRQGWQTFFEQHKLTPLNVDYDELAADPAGMAQQVIAHANVPHTPVTQVTLPRVERQADGTNTAWAERFRREEGVC
jgi:LPS sulfotransferase NodH